MPNLHTLASDTDRQAVARIIRFAFAGTPEGVLEWMKLGGEENIRTLKHDSAVVATLLQIPMGIYLGGRAVPMVGVAGVGVGPENRGQGYAKRLMRSFVQDAAEAGWPLAGLYASTHTLYRAVGFDHATHRFQYNVPLGQIDAGHDTGPLQPITDADEPHVRACYAEFAAQFDGMLDRGPYIWNRIRKFRETEYQGYAVRNAAGGFDGYVYLNQARRPDGRQDVTLSDLAFTTTQAASRLLGFLADFRMMGEDLVFFGGPTHPALTLLKQQRYDITLKDSSFLRVLDVRGVLERRGYPASLSARVELDVADDLLQANHGAWTLTVERGKPVVERGGSGAVKCTIRGLATLLTGYYTPRQAALTGEVSGSREALAAAASIFSQGTPLMSDMY